MWCEAFSDVRPLAASVAPVVPAKSVSLTAYEELFALWQKSSMQRRDTTVDAYWKTLKQFAQIVRGKPLHELTRKDVVMYRDTLLEQGYSVTTTINKVSIIRRLFESAMDYELMDDNPAQNIKTLNKPSIKQRVAFDAQDLHRIFNSPVYTEKLLPRGGGYEAAYWLPLLALYTGARVEELAQLLVRDVRFVNGLGHYLNITDEATHAKLKNASSRRRIPVHPVLLACGFMDYVAKGQADRLLFPHLKPNPRGKLAGYFSTWFSLWLRNTLRITDPRKVFHSFRHTFKDCCRQMGIEEAVHDALTGHSNSSAGRKYGNEQYPLEPLFQAMMRFDVAGIDLSHLFVKPLIKRRVATDQKIVSAFYGLVAAFATNNPKHIETPTLLLQYQGHELLMNIESSEAVYGQLPANKQLLANAWVEIHREELLANWHMGRDTGDYFKIEPLR